jgi:hypothetical protein
MSKFLNNSLLIELNFFSADAKSDPFAGAAGRNSESEKWDA